MGKVQTDILSYQEGEQTLAVKVGSPQWFNWLETATTTSFSYTGPTGHFTARKELLGAPRKSWYWKAYRKAANKLQRVHLGKSQDLSAERLSQVAGELSRKITEAALQTGQAPLKFEPPETLVTTKLYLPRLYQTFARPRLLQSLKKAAQARLVVVSAPPGFGKTTLVASWLQTQPGGWFSIDETDNDPVRFWRYFVQAVAGPGHPEGLSVEQTLVWLINHIAALQQHLFVVLDDYHLITSPVIHQNLAYFLDRVSEHCHLVIISRTNPPLPLARWRARNQIIELRESDLRFSAEEIRHYLAPRLKLRLSAEQVAMVEERTEGWIAALQMLVLSMQGRQDLDRFITSFSGSHHFVLDYLTAEVLAQLPEPTQQLLFKSAILDRLNDDLVTEVVGQPLRLLSLQALEQANLFLIPLDQERNWFRFHHLFREYLYKQLQQNCGSGDQIPRLHQKAAAWYARHNLPKDAIAHYLKAHQFESAARLIQQTAQTILMQGELYTLENWLEALPPPVYQRQPDLFLVKGWVYSANGQLKAAEQLLQSSLIKTGQGESTAIQTLLAILHLDLDKVFELAGQNLENLPENTTFLRDFKLMIEGIAASLHGDLTRARQAYTRALASSRQSGNVMVASVVVGQLGELLLQQGQLKRAVEVYREAPALTVLRPPEPRWAAPSYKGMFEAYYEWNRLDEAGFYAREANRMAEKYDNNLFFLFGRVLLARYYLATGQPHQALELIQTIEHDNLPGHSTLTAFADLYRVQILIACDRREQVLNWLNQVEARSAAARTELRSGLVVSELFDLTLGQAMLYLGQPDRALAIFSRCSKMSLENGRSLWAVRALVGQAVASYQQQALEPALDSMEQALQLAQPEELIRSFVDLHPSVAILLEKARARPLPRPVATYLHRLLKVFSPPKSAAPTPEPLTERELEVIKLLQSGLTNKELAARLVISVGTVTWHLKNLYAKLEVRNRTEAIVRARQLNLIHP